jgi:hypothetical protein
MKSDPLQGIIIVKAPTVSMRTTANYRKIQVISDGPDYNSDSGRISSTNLIKILNKLRSFS